MANEFTDTNITGDLAVTGTITGDGSGLTGLPGGGDMTLAGVQTVTGAKSFDDGKLIVKGSTSGTTTLKAAATAGTTVATLPAATGTIAYSTVPYGGTGAATFTDGGVIIGNGTGALQATSAGTAGHVLTSNGAGVDPTFQAATGGGITALTGDVTASGSGSVAATIAAGAVDIAMLSATGTPSSSTYLRGDNTWATPAGSGAVDSVNGATGVVVLDADDIDDTSTTNKFTTASEISKLAGIESGATADQTDAEIETAYNNQVSVVAQAEAEAGSATTVRRWTALRVAQAIAALAPGVTLAGTPNYLTIAGQVITRALIDLTSHVTGRLPLANIATFAQATIAGRADAAGTGDLTALTAAQVRTIINVADGADVSTVTASNTLTFTNKRLTPRVGTTTSSATPTINTDNYDLYIITAQAVDITSLTTNLSGTPTTGQTLDLWITGTAARAITPGASFGSGAATFPSTTVTTKTLYIRNVWDGSIWRCMATGSNP